MVTKNVLAIPLPTSHVLCQTSRQPDVDDSETPLRICFGTDDPRAEKIHKTLRRPLASIVRTNGEPKTKTKTSQIYQPPMPSSTSNIQLPKPTRRTAQSSQPTTSRRPKAHSGPSLSRASKQTKSSRIQLALRLLQSQSPHVLQCGPARLMS